MANPGRWFLVLGAFLSFFLFGFWSIVSFSFFFFFFEDMEGESSLIQ